MDIKPEHHYRDKRTRQNCIDITSTLEEEGACTRKELQSLCGMGRSKTLRAIKKLQRDGRVDSKKHPEDGRKTLYTISENPSQGVESL